MTVSVGKEQQVIEWLDKYTIMEDAKFIRASETLHQFGLFGPRSFDLVKQFTDVDLINLPTFSTIETTVAGFPVLIQKFVRLAESGWLVFASSDVSGDVKQFLEAEVLALGGAVLDDETFDVIRIESGMPVAPNELNEKHNPLESTLVSAVSFTKGCYIGQEVIARLDSYDKVQRHMLGVVVNGVAADVLAEVNDAAQLQKALDPNARVSFEIFARDGEAAGGWSALGENKAIGEMTSYAISPGMDKFVGLAYIRTAHATPGNKLALKVKPEALLPVQVVKLPFDV
jgi:folate-binding protein YgfZ